MFPRHIQDMALHQVGRLLLSLELRGQMRGCGPCLGPRGGQTERAAWDIPAESSRRQWNYPHHTGIAHRAFPGGLALPWPPAQPEPACPSVGKRVTAQDPAQLGSWSTYRGSIIWLKFPSREARVSRLGQNRVGVLPALEETSSATTCLFLQPPPRVP